MQAESDSMSQNEQGKRQGLWEKMTAPTEAQSQGSACGSMIPRRKERGSPANSGPPCRGGCSCSVGLRTGWMKPAVGGCLGLFLEGAERVPCAAHTPQPCRASLIWPRLHPSPRHLPVLCTVYVPPCPPSGGHLTSAHPSWLTKQQSPPWKLP